jgi:hypothetical protein
MMEKEPSQRAIAEASGLTEAEVGTYLTRLERQPNGAWIAYFAQEIENSPELAAKMPKNKQVLIPADSKESGNDQGNG